MANSSRTPGSFKDKAESLASSASHAAGEAKGKAQEKASGTMEKAQEIASGVGQKAQDLASSAAQKTEGAISTVGEKMSSLAGTLRERAPHEGAMGTAATTVADQLQAGGRYLQDHRLEDMADDVSALVRRYPMQSILVGFGMGFLLGQTFSRR